MRVARRGFFTAAPPIQFETSKELPFLAHRFFGVVKDVDAYADFIQFMTSSVVFADTKTERITNNKREGAFDAETRIGFQAVSFAYLSQVSYSEPVTLKRHKQQSWRISSISPTASIFNKLESHWRI